MVYDLIEEKKCDLVVLGGSSGMVAAVRAAQLSGKKVYLQPLYQSASGDKRPVMGFLQRFPGGDQCR